jgi:predicted transcriptional regulator
MSECNGARLDDMGPFGVLPPDDPPPPSAGHEPAGVPRKNSLIGPEGRRAQDRFATINAFADFALGGLSRAGIAVWVLLWRDTKPDGLARTSQADLARRAGCDLSTVKRAVRKLVGAGLLERVRRGRLGGGPTTYRVRSMRPE